MSGANEFIFSGSSAAIKRGLRELDRATQTPYNKLQSILYDRSMIIKELAKIGMNTMPIFGNARTGCWYAPNPNQSVVFKSTDGHYGTWEFSLRKLNLHFLLNLQKSRSAVIIDATKAGQRYPDAIKRTIPIWCLVWSAVLSGSCLSELDLNEFFLQSITPAERELIVQKAETHVSNLKKLIHLILGSNDRYLLESIFLIRSIYCRYWYINQNGLCQEDFEPSLTKGGDTLSTCTLHLVSASKEAPYPIHLVDDQGAPFYYIQGAADDAESWLPLTLTPSAFAENPSLFCNLELSSLDTNEYKTILNKRNLITPVKEVFVRIRCPEQHFVIITNSVDAINREPLSVCISLHRPNQSPPSSVSTIVSIPIRRNLKYITNLPHSLETIHTRFRQLRLANTIIFYSGQDYQVALAAFISSMSSENLVPCISKTQQGQVELIAVPSTTLHFMSEDTNKRILYMDIWESALSLILESFSLQKNLRQVIHSFTCTCQKDDSIAKIGT